MQLIKWMIIFLMPVFFLPEPSQASFFRKEETGSSCCTLQSQESSFEHLRETWLKDFFSTPGDLPENSAHITYDKKTFPALLLYPGYRVLPPTGGLQVQPLRLQPPHLLCAGVNDYVYRLQKILI